MTIAEEYWRQWGNSAPSAGSEFEYKGISYTVSKVLGAGGQAVSVLVTNDKGEDCVFKVHSSPDGKAAQKELKAAKKIKSTRCAEVHDLLESEGNVYGIIYEYIEGRTLKEISKDKNHPLTSIEIQKICIDILLALNDLHQHNLVHRDITPGNIVILPNNREARLIDFGLTTTTNAQTRMGFGTEPYMAPERWSLAPASPGLDIYGFAATMIEVLVPKFQDWLTRPGPMEPFRFDGVPTDVIETVDGLSRALLVQLEKGMRFEPQDRPRSALEFADFIIEAADIPVVEGTPIENVTVAGLLSVRVGSAGVLAGENKFTEITKVDTRLESVLLPKIVNGELDVAFLSGNPGDGKTSFIRLLEKHLLSIGGSFLSSERSTGWEIQLGQRVFGAIFDASESVDGVSSDDRIRAVLRKSETVGFTAILAVNDGRLDAFLRDFQDEFEFSSDIRQQLRGLPAADPRKLLIDLKRRSLVTSGSHMGLGLKNLSSFTDGKLWEECSTCLSRRICPILQNAKDLNRLEVQSSVEELLTISHLRRQRRATFRDVRSVFAYLITGDHSCSSIHRAREEGRDLRRSSKSRFYDLAFSGESQDHLIASWSELDPAFLPLSGIGRIAAKERELVDKITGLSQLSSLGRKVFFNVSAKTYSSVSKEEVRLYRHFEEYSAQLLFPTSMTKKKILLGVSRIAGAIGFIDNGVAIRTGSMRTDWSVLKVISDEEFEVASSASNEVQYIESSPDRLMLVHKETGIAFGLSLDSFEVLLRAAEGEILADIYSDAVIKEVDGFASQLRDVRSTSVSVINPIGGGVLATEKDGRIELVKQ